MERKIKERRKGGKRRKMGGKKEREERTGLLVDLQLLINMIIYLKRTFKEILASKMFLF